MNSSVRIGRILGVPLRMHWSVPLLVVLIGYGLGHGTLPAWVPGRSDVAYATSGVIGSVLLTGSLLLHEAAHAAIARRSGIAVEDVTLWAMGGITRMGRPQTARTALAVAAGGPLTSLLLGGVALAAGLGVRAIAAGWELPAAVLLWLGWANLLLAAFNLLPAIPLDGGRVVLAALWWRTGQRDRAELAADRAGQVLGLLLVTVGWFTALRGSAGGLWLAAIGLFVALAAGAERQRAVLRVALRGVRVADAMSSPVFTAPDWLTVDRFVQDHATRAHHSAVPLVDVDGRPSGIVTMRHIALLPAERRTTVRVRDLATPLAQCTTAAPDEYLNDVLDRVRTQAGLRILAMEDGRLTGIVTPHDLMRLLGRHDSDSGPWLPH
jgi:Zn-dependent protease